MLRFVSANSLEQAFNGQSEEEIVKRKRENESSDEEDAVSTKHKNLLRNINSDESDLDSEINATVEEEEKDLENLLFGSKTSMLENIEKVKKKSKPKTNLAKEKVEIADEMETRIPVWQDPADQEIVDLKDFNQFSTVVSTKSERVTSSQIEESLKSRFSKYYGTSMWADLDFNQKKKLKRENKKSQDKKSADDGEDEQEENEDDEMFQQTGNFLQDSDKKFKTRTTLPGTNIDIKMCTDANKEEPHQARLKSVEFHPSARVFLTAGLGQKLTLFQIDGKKNAKIQTIFIEKFPILAAHFTKLTGDEIILGSRHKNFYYYDMHAGKMVTIVPPVKALDEFQRPSMSTNFEISPDNRFIAFVGSQGQIHLFATKSKEWIDTLKINDSCNAITFSVDSRYLFAIGDGKDVYVFDMNDRGHRCLNRFADDGCLNGTSIAVSNNSQFIATGCNSGVVNIYNLNEGILGSKRNPKPIKSFMNLTTPCTSLKFNGTSEILAASSAYGENACKLIHTGSMTVFSNFPIQTDKSSIYTRMRMPECIDFSLNSGYFAIGNNKGNALLYRLKHYGSF